MKPSKYYWRFFICLFAFIYATCRIVFAILSCFCTSSCYTFFVIANIRGFGEKPIAADFPINYDSVFPFIKLPICSLIYQLNLHFSFCPNLQGSTLQVDSRKKRLQCLKRFLKLTKRNYRKDSSFHQKGYIWKYIFSHFNIVPLH